MISVLVPAYNHRRYVAAALTSVGAQSFEDIEVVIVDDASTDGTAAVIAETIDTAAWRQRFRGRTKFVEAESNSGAPAAINQAALLASGETLAILNSDDRFLPTRLECLAQALGPGCELAFSRCLFVDGGGCPIPDLDSRVLGAWEAQNRISRYPTTGFSFLHENAAITTGNLFMTHRLFDELGGMAALRYCHDWDFCLRAALRTEPLFEPQPLYEYRVHGRNEHLRLGHIAEQETRLVRRRFLDEHWLARNPLAPTPQAWPELYELLAEWAGMPMRG